MAAVCALGSCSRMMPLPGDFEPVDEQLQLLLRRHRIPVAGPEVGAEHHNAALTAGDRAWLRHLEVGKAEERRARGRGRDAVKRHFDRGNALVDLGRGSLRLHVFEIVVRPGVMADGVAFGGDPSHQRRDARRRACRSGRTWRARIRWPAPPAPCVVAGHGPSSKVSTTSRSSSGRVCGKLFRPTRGDGRRIDA